MESFGQAKPVAAVNMKRIEARRTIFRVFRRPWVIAGVFDRRVVPHSGHGAGSVWSSPWRLNLHFLQCGFGERSLPRMAIRRRKTPISAEVIENTSIVNKFGAIMDTLYKLLCKPRSKPAYSSRFFCAPNFNQSQTTTLFNPHPTVQSCSVLWPTVHQSSPAQRVQGLSVLGPH